jgi:FAD/FMN-containing dehydrogenase
LHVDGDAVASTDVFSYALSEQAEALLTPRAAEIECVPEALARSLPETLQRKILQLSRREDGSPCFAVAEVRYGARGGLSNSKGEAAFASMRRNFLDNLLGILGHRAWAYPSDDSDYLLFPDFEEGSLEGSIDGLLEQAEAVQAIAKEHGGKDFVWATRPEERTQLWQARHDAYFACLQIRPGSRAVSTDVCVPISRLAECVHETMEDVKSYIAPVPLLGHVGDGNFHLMFLVDPAKPEETELAKEFNRRLVERALRLEGSCTGEHGVGMGKQESLRAELGDDMIDVMRDIKKLFDPENLMNPGKVVPFQ